MVEKFKEINEILKEMEEKAEIVSGKLTECLNEFDSRKNKEFTEEESKLIEEMDNLTNKIAKTIVG